MATLFMDNGEIYGVSAAALNGMYAQVSSDITTGIVANKICFTLNGGDILRKVLPATYTNLFTGFRWYVTSLPSTTGQGPFVDIRDTNNNTLGRIYIDTTGRLNVTNSAGAIVATSTSPVITASTWHYIEMNWQLSSTSGYLEVRIDDSSTPCLVYSGAFDSTTPIAQVAYGSNTTTSSLTDMHVWDTTGTRNTTFIGDFQVAVLWPVTDVQTGWTPNYRKKIGNGIGSFTNGVLAFADNPRLNPGSGDYTIESFFRFTSLPTSNNRVPLIAKWCEVNANQRSFELSLCGPGLNGGNIEFRISTDGTANTTQTLFSQPYTFNPGQWYHIAVSRASGQTMLFINGVLQNVPVTDVNTYYACTWPIVIGGGTVSFTGSAEYAGLNSQFIGYMDETRYTTAARYTTNFTPTTVPFGRNLANDSLWNNVVLLLGYESAPQDESQYNETPYAPYNNTVMPTSYLPDDGIGQWSAIGAEDTEAFLAPRDDTYISATLSRATNILTLGGNPTDGQTVTIGSQVYTFKTALTTGYQVLIGASISASLHNLAQAINGGTGAGTLYSSDIAANPNVQSQELPSPQMEILANTAGSAGNSIGPCSTNIPSSVWATTNLSGGADIPGPSSFKLSRLPIGITIVRSVMAVTRAFKTEAGPAKMKTNFVGAGGTITQGPEIALAVNPTYNTAVFELDPDTGTAITPATLTSGQIQFNRTV